ncbi:MAG: hypothetical protein AAF566_00145 [Pseudomonadota bacterium]
MMLSLRHVLVGICDPRKVLFAAVLVAAVGLLAGYVTVQEQLDRDLALRQGPPPPVMIQDFAPGRDVGPAGEVRITGEIDMSAAATVFERGRSPRQWVLVAPVFPVSAVGSARLAGSAPEQSGVLSAQVERRVTGPDHRSTAIGLVVLPIDDPDAAPSDPAMLSEAVLGDGDYGQVVTLLGTETPIADLTLVAHGALAARGVTLAQSFVAVSPYVGGRLAVLAAPVPSGLRDDLFALALLLLATAGVLQLWWALHGFSGELRRISDRDLGEKGTAPHCHPEFAPLPTQAEISLGDLHEADGARAPRAALSGITQRIRLGRVRLRARLRNPRSRSEDEAL